MPSRSDVYDYQQLKEQLFHMAGEINGQFGSPENSPIQLVYGSVNNVELCALYRVADALMVSSIRDGMNLVSVEFLACKNENSDLLLSIFAGSYQCLGEVCSFNPWNIKETSELMHRTLVNRSCFPRKAVEFIKQNTAEKWGSSFLSRLEVLTRVHIRSIYCFCRAVIKVTSKMLSEASKNL